MNDSNFPALRTNSQYTDIENFKDYEFTHNIKYELAIRNADIQELVKSFVHIWVQQEVPRDILIHTTSDLKYSKETAYKLGDHFIDVASLYLEYHFFKDEVELISSHQATHKDDTLSTPNSILFDTKNSENIFTRGKETRTMYHTQKTNLFEKVLVYKETQSTKKREISRHEITPRYSRPTLQPFYNTNTLKVNLDLSLPVKELSDFIVKLKCEKDKGRISHLTISSLLNINHIENQSIKHKKKRLADMFFIYDYITFKLNHEPSRTAKSILKTEKKFLERIIGKQIDTIEKDYYIIEDTIKNCEYKTLT